MTSTPIHKTNNAAVVKRMGRSTVMKTAWMYFRKGNVASFGAALKAAWIFLSDLVGMELTSERDAKREERRAAVWTANAARRDFAARNFGRGSRGYNVAVASR